MADKKNPQAEEPQQEATPTPKPTVESQIADLRMEATAEFDALRCELAELKAKLKAMFTGF